MLLLIQESKTRRFLTKFGLILSNVFFRIGSGQSKLGVFSMDCSCSLLPNDLFMALATISTYEVLANDTAYKTFADDNTYEELTADTACFDDCL